MGLFSHFYKRPRPNQVFDEDGNVVCKHEGEAWMDLFIDLVFVAFFIKLGQAITYCQVHQDDLESRVLSSAFFLFLIFFFLRLELDTYANYFHASDVVSRILYFFFMMGIGAMSISMPGDEQGDCFYLGLKNSVFLGGFVFANASLISMYITALRANKETQIQFGYHVFVACIFLFLYVVLGLSLPREHRDVLYKVMVPAHILLTIPFLGQHLRPYFNDVLGPYLFSTSAQIGHHDLVIVPLNIHAFQSRLCLFIMMVTGEGMIQIISPTLPESSHYYWRIFLFNTSGFVILFGNAMLYADAVLKDVAGHVLTRSPRVAGLFWTWMHVATGFFIYLIGISIEIAIHDVYENEPILHAHDTIMGISCGCITLCLNLMRSTHKGIVLLDPLSPDKNSFKKNLYRVFNYIFRSILGFLHFIVAAFTFEEDSEAKRAHDKYIYMHASIVVVSIAVEIALSTYVKIRRRNKESMQNIGVESSKSKSKADALSSSKDKNGLHQKLLSKEDETDIVGS